MNVIVTTSLWIYAAMEALGILIGISDAKKARVELEPAGGCLAGMIILACAAAPALLLMTTHSTLVRVLAAVLAVSVLYDLAQLVRHAHGVRGPKTPASTFLHALWGLANLSVITYVLLKG